jgi:hypothetical protein
MGGTRSIPEKQFLAVLGYNSNAKSIQIVEKYIKDIRAKTCICNYDEKEPGFLSSFSFFYHPLWKWCGKLKTYMW